jgi:hypothetical protein
MHSGSGTGSGPGSNTKCNTTVKKINKLETNFLGNNAAYGIEKARFFAKIFVVEKLC